MFDIFTLLIAFQFKHFICDYPLQTSYMLGKMRATNWVLPLTAHAAVHAIGTFTVSYIFLLNLSYTLDAILFASILSVTDFVVHFFVDRLKASPNLGGKFNPTQPYFWWALGADQMAHHLTHYFLIFTLILLGA